ncbi:MAG: LLM class flavin-dependent oxidoreductase [Actinobacteria bacterium]|nr:LLM class flavin-dependent oxidoreductase [Actinomycetota bacterium]
MRFGLDVAQQRVPFDEVVARTQLAEDLGFDGAWGFDHFQPMYGDGPGECYEGLTTLAALASATSRIRLGLMIMGVTYRHPSLFANQALTIDHASHGRFEMSLGAAWFEPEHRALGMRFPSTRDRFDLLEDTLEIVTRLMTGERVSYSGKQASIEDAQMRPLPVQQPHPPIWIGGTGPKRLIPIAAKWADVWHAFGTPKSLAETKALLERLAEENGRDPASITKAGSLSISEPIDTVKRHVEKWRDAGYGYVVCGWPEEGRARVEEVAAQVLPEFAE